MAQLQVRSYSNYDVNREWGGVGVSPGYFKERSHWMELREGRISVAQLDGGDAQGPDVAAGVVGGVQLLLARYHLKK